MYPDGNIWNSAALVVSTIGPPGFISTLICEGGSGVAVSVLAGGRLQPVFSKNTMSDKSTPRMRARRSKIFPQRSVFIIALPYPDP